MPLQAAHRLTLSQSPGCPYLHLSCVDNRQSTLYCSVLILEANWWSRSRLVTQDNKSGRGKLGACYLEILNQAAHITLFPWWGTYVSDNFRETILHVHCSLFAGSVSRSAPATVYTWLKTAQSIVCITRFTADSPHQVHHNGRETHPGSYPTSPWRAQSRIRVVIPISWTSITWT